jgi:hypothetical protein
VRLTSAIVSSSNSPILPYFLALRQSRTPRRVRFARLGWGATFEGSGVGRPAGCASLGVVGSALRPQPAPASLFRPQIFVGRGVGRQDSCAGLGTVGSALPALPCLLFRFQAQSFVGRGVGRQASCTGLGAAGSALPALPHLLSIFLGTKFCGRRGEQAGQLCWPWCDRLSPAPPAPPSFYVF